MEKSDNDVPDGNDPPPSYELTSNLGQPSPRFAMIYLHRSDCIRLLQFPKQVEIEIGGVIVASWPKGVKKRTYANGCLEFHLEGTPWAGVMPCDAIHGRDLLAAIFSFLWAHSWVLIANPFHTVYANSKDSLIFRHVNNATGEATTSSAPSSSMPFFSCLSHTSSASVSSPQSFLPPVDFLALSFPPTDRLRVHAGADDNTLMELRQLLEVHGYFKSAERRETAWEFKMKGMPWAAMFGDQPLRLRRFVLALTETMNRLGWNTYATIKQRDAYDDPKPDTWYFTRPKDWVHGSPFNRPVIGWGNQY